MLIFTQKVQSYKFSNVLYEVRITSTISDHKINICNVDFYTKGTVKPPVEIAEEDVAVALKNCTPISLQGVQLYKGAGHVWSDIGGLAEVKRSLVEILQWPLKYPEIFKNAPIKLQNGVLLYGMPGTGKTMLAKAIANECGVNLISVKVRTNTFLLSSLFFLLFNLVI